MKTAIVWLLVVQFGHSGYTVPAISSKDDCEALALSLKEKQWTRLGIFGEHTHICVPYRQAQ